MSIVTAEKTTGNKLPNILWESRDIHQAVFVNMPDAVFIIDENSMIMEVNKKACTLLGFERNELIELRLDELYGDFEIKNISELPSILKEKGGYHCKNVIRSKEGNVIPVESDYISVKMANQNVIIVIVRDITEQKNLEDDLKSSFAKLKERIYERTSKLAKMSREFQLEIEKRKAIQIENELSRVLIPHLHDAVIVTDLEGQVVRWLGKAKMIFGYSSEDIEGKKVSILYDPSVKDQMCFEITRSIGESGKFAGEIPCVRKDGDSIIVESFIRPVLDENGKHILNTGDYRDISASRKLKTVILKSEMRYGELANSLQNFIIRIDLEGRITFANDNYCRKLMKTREDLINKEKIFFFDNGLFNLKDTTECKESPKDNRTACITIPPIIEQFAKTGEGWRWIAWINSPIRDVHGNTIEFQCVGNDVTMLKKTEEKMRSYQQRLQSLAFEMSVIEERQRRTIAQVLHDSIGQSLALCNLQLGALSSSHGSRESRDKIDQIQETIKNVIKETRSLTSELNPPALYEIGLGKAIERLTEKIFKEHNLRIRYYEHGEPIQLGVDFTGLLFQVTRELFVNIVKHAKAQNANVHLSYLESQIQIEVQDDGIGFDKNYLYSNADKSNCFGLFSISERIQLLGGFVKINSKPGSGTEITLCVPHKLNVPNNGSIEMGKI